MEAGSLLRLDRAIDLDAVPEKRPRRWPFSPWHLFLIPLSAAMLLPLVWSVITSLETASEAQRFPPVLIPKSLQFQNYVHAWQALPFGHFFLNSFLYSAATVAGNLLFCSLAAYAFARIRFFGSNVLFVLLLVTLMVPFQVVIIPTFLIVRHLGLIDSVGGLIVPNLCGVFGIFLLRQFFMSLPVQLEEAARIDGASRLGILFKIVLPLSAPVLATLAIIQFMWSWNDFLWPLIIITTPEHSPLQLGLSMFQGAHVTQWNLLMAGTVMSQIPMLAVFLIAQRWFIQSIAYTGIKQ
ncbi:MAG TPA: carbohydrate ABC transporter permease [Thermoleophilia bacterium]|nr:carbohydrate ABC transporter permease [Thermoleophilia bacterium]HZL64984.1 carbohydrate ABC transporter permease [Thermoleophilia bacterium]